MPGKSGHKQAPSEVGQGTAESSIYPAFLHALWVSQIARWQSSASSDVGAQASIQICKSQWFSSLVRVESDANVLPIFRWPGSKKGNTNLKHGKSS